MCSRNRNITGIATAVFVFVLLASQNAVAQPFELFPCKQSVTNSLWLRTSDQNDWQLSEECPYRLTVGAESDTDDNQIWRFPRSSRTNVPLIGMSVKLKGNSGSAFGKRQGIGAMNGNTYPFANVDLSVPTLFEWGPGTGQIPIVQPARAAVISAQCLWDLCPGSPVLEMSDLKMTFDDSTPPRIASPATSYIYVPGGFITPEPGQWYNSGLSVSWTATDRESGVTHTKVLPPRGDPMLFDSGCGWESGSIRDLCPATRSEQFKVYPGDSSRWQEGRNTVEIVTEDIAKNQASTAFTFNIDTVRPEHPTNLLVPGVNERGWLNSNVFDVSWFNPSEQFETEYESGIRSVVYGLNPVDAEVVDYAGGEVEQPGVETLTEIEAPSDGIWNLSLQTVDGAGNWSEAGETLVRIERLVLAAPEIEPVDWVNREELLEGSLVRWHPPANAAESHSGICEYSYEVGRDAGLLGSSSEQLPGDANELSVRTLLDAGRNYIFLRARSCAGVSGEVAVAPIDVDLTDPSISIAPQDDIWRPSPTEVELNASDSTSGVREVRFTIDGGETQTVEGDEVRIELPTGEHVVSGHAVDRAGNKSSTVTRRIRVDGEPPSGAIAPQSPLRPAEVIAEVRDGASGLAKAWIEYEAVDGYQIAAPAISKVYGFEEGVQTATVTGQLPATEMPPGLYRLKLMAVDRVGNRSVTVLRSDGQPAIVKSPVLGSTVLTAGFLELTSLTTCASRERGGRCRKRTRNRIQHLTTSTVTDAGKRVMLTGRLATSSGTPLAGARLRVLSTEAGKTSPVPVAEVLTDGNGMYRVALPAGPNRLLEVRFAGSPISAPVVARATLLVRSRVVFSIRPRAIVEGSRFRLVGKLFTGRAGDARAGNLVQIEYMSRGRWRVFGVVHTDPYGMFELREALNGFSRPVTIKFRARVEQSAAWPYLTGYSPAVSLKVRPR